MSSKGKNAAAARLADTRPGLERIVAYVLETQASLRLYHWNTRSHPRHVATDALLQQLQRAGDLIVEAAIGQASLVNRNPTGQASPPNDHAAALADYRIAPPLLQVTAHDDRSIILYLDERAQFLANEMPKLVLKWDSSGLASPRDDLLAAIHRTLYLYKLVM